MSDVKRREFLNSPGEALLVTSDPLEYIRRFDRFIDASGLPPERVLASPLIGVPLPVAQRDPNGQPKRWSEAAPWFLWHPLMWMPRHLALRYRFRTIAEGAGGSAEDFEIEPDAMWAIRVGLEMIASGLYNPEDGTWLDVLALHGLDIDNPVDYARVEQWLRGAPDPVLDAIDLTSMMPGAGNADHAVQTAAELASILVPAQWSITASGLLEVVAERADASPEGGAPADEDLLTLVTVMGQVATQTLHEVPPDPETGEDVVDAIGLLAEAAHVPGASARLLVESFAELLSKVADDYAPAVAELNAKAGW